MRLASRTFALLVAGLVVLSGCRTAEGVYTDAMAYETAGQMEAAAGAYADALRRDPELPNARGRLVVAGREAVRMRIVQAQSAGSLSGAADHWLAAEALVHEASGVGVSLDRPATFDEDVATACANAVDALLDDGISRAEAGDYANALSQLDRARRYRPSAERRADLDETARRTYSDWSEADLAAGRFRAALAHADAAVPLTPPNSDLAADLADLRGRIFEAGTLFAAVFPAETPRTPRGDRLPQGFLRDVSDVLLDDRLAPPPPFIALVDPVETRRIVRRADSDLAGNARLLARLTDDLGADVGLIPEIDGFALDETETGRRDVTFRLRSGEGSAAGVRVTHEMTLRVRADLSGVFADGRRLACPGEASFVVLSERYDTATTDTDRQTLRLSDDDRDLFDSGTRDRAYSRLVTRLRDGVAEALAARTVGCLAPLVP